MSTIIADPHAVPETEPHVNWIRASHGLKSWLFTLDHKRIGIMYLCAVVFFFLAAGLMALGIRWELWTAEGDTFSADTYNRIFTLHGALMIFVFIIPSIPASLGNFFLPIHLGAKDVAFPRLNLASFYIYLAGAFFLLYAMVRGALDTGWTMYTPYSTQASEFGVGIAATLFAVFILGFSSILTGLNFIVTTHKMRAKGLTWTRLPLFVWSLYATAIIQVLATPILAITVLLLLLERYFGIGIFDPANGGDPVLFQHFFWFYSHPAVYIMILPGFGIVSEVVAVHSRKPIFGYKAIAGSSVAIAMFGFLVWGHHMFVSGQSEWASTIFSFLTFAVAIPTGIKIFSWIATMWRGSIAINAPMLYVLSFLALFTIGGLTGVVLGALSVDVHLHDTYFVVGHFHYVMVGGTVVAFIAGLHHWWPKMFGRMYHEGVGILSCALVFIGFNLAFFPQLVMGAMGMPRRYHSYDHLSAPLQSALQTWHQASTVGAMLLGFGLLVALVNLVVSLFNGKKAPADPWGGATLEWTHAASPPDVHNFEVRPQVTFGPYDFVSRFERGDHDVD